MYIFLNKKQIKDNYYFEIYFFGNTILLKVPKDYFDNCALKFGDIIPEDNIEQSFYKKGYDLICNLKIK